MDKRNKLWRREKQKRVFKALMIPYAAYGHRIFDKEDNWIEHHKEQSLLSTKREQ